MRGSLLALAVLVVTTGCGRDDHDEPTAGNPCRDGTHQLLGAVTDEACIAFLDAEASAVTDDTRAPRFSEPLAGATVQRASPPRFAWSRGTLARTTRHRLLRFLSPIGEAWAHGEINGDAFVLTFRDGTGKEVHRAFTDALEYTPDAAAWARIRGASSLQVTLTGVRFTKNAIATGTRPTAGSPLALTLEG
jgi:hypothetical protein